MYLTDNNIKRKPKDSIVVERTPKDPEDASKGDWIVILKYGENGIIKWQDGKFYHKPLLVTDRIDCSRVCKAGSCNGHKISLKKFIDKFCDGKMPEELKEPKGVKR